MTNKIKLLQTILEYIQDGDYRLASREIKKELEVIYNPVAWILTCDNPPQAHLNVMKTELEFIAKQNCLIDYEIKPLYYGD